MTESNLYEEALGLLSLGRSEEAVSLLEGIEDVPDEARHEEALAQALVYAGYSTRGLKLAKRALSAGRDTPVVRATIAMAQNQLSAHGTIAEAEPQGTSSDPERLTYASWAALQKGRYSEAAALAREANGFDPSYVPAECMLLEAMAALGDETAIPQLKELWFLDHSIGAATSAISAAGRAGTLELVADLVTSVRESRSVDTRVYGYIVQYYLDRRAFADALSALAEAREEIRSHPAMDALRGQTLVTMRDYAAAVIPLKRAFDTETANEVVFKNYLLALRKRRLYRQMFRAARQYFAAIRSIARQ